MPRSRHESSGSAPADPQETIQIPAGIGEGVEPDLDEAMKCYRLAAEQGHEGAQERLKFLELRDRLFAEALADESLRGGVHDGVYTSPDKSFQFIIARLIEPGIFVDDARKLGPTRYSFVSRK
jgi:hypothetical protein